MRIACPTCETTYEVPDALLKPGRAVRCTQCSLRWTPVVAVPAEEEPPLASEDTTDDAEPGAPENAVPFVSAMDRLAAGQRRVAANGLLLAWIGSILLLLAAAGVTYVWRSSVVRAWPPAAWVLRADGSPAKHAEPVRP